MKYLQMRHMLVEGRLQQLGGIQHLESKSSILVLNLEESEYARNGMVDLRSELSATCMKKMRNVFIQ